MKNLLLLFLSTFTFSLMAEEDLRIIPQYYNIISDEKDDLVNKDEFLLEGKIQMFSSLSPIENVLVGCTSSGTWTKSDSLGEFSIRLDKNDKRVYFYLDGWNELVIEDYTFKAGHKIVMNVYLVQERDDNQMMKRKPVIYLYADQPMSAEIELNPLGEFTFTYPKYENSWNVEIDANDDLNVDGKKYPYLFWEAKSQDLNYDFESNSINGFLLASNEVIEFLERSLTEIGLNQTEKTDFITYWGPILCKKKYAFIQFIQDDDYQSKVAEIAVKPKPDSSKRLFILCSNLDDDNIGVDIKPQKLSSFERKGFTLVEWGGSIIDFNQIGH